MKSRILNFLLCTYICFGAGAQVTLNNVTLPATIKQDNTELTLNGGGIRKKLFFKVYTAGLYVTDKSKDGNAIAAADKPTAVRLTITSSVINSNNMSDAIQEGFGKSMKGNTAPLQSQITSFIATFKKEEIKEGDVFEMWYIPGVGVKSYKNGQYKSAIPGLDFKKALFGIWLSDTPLMKI
jgi:hypothetical protein